MSLTAAQKEAAWRAEWEAAHAAATAAALDPYPVYLTTAEVTATRPPNTYIRTVSSMLSISGRQRGDFCVVAGTSAPRSTRIFWLSNDDGSFATDWLEVNVGQIRANPATSATTPGSVVKKIEVFDTAGVSQGFLALYGSIT